MYVQASDGKYYTEPYWFGQTCKAFVKCSGGSVVGFVASSGTDDYARRKLYSEMEKLDGLVKLGQKLRDDTAGMPPTFWDMESGQYFMAELRGMPPPPDCFGYEVDHIDLLSDLHLVWEHDFAVKQVLGYIRGEDKYPLLEAFYGGLSRMRIKNMILKQTPLVGLTGYVKLRRKVRADP